MLELPARCQAIYSFAYTGAYPSLNCIPCNMHHAIYTHEMDKCHRPHWDVGISRSVRSSAWPFLDGDGNAGAFARQLIAGPTPPRGRQNDVLYRVEVIELH